MVHGRTQSALSQVYACKYAHSRLNHRHSNGYSRDLFFFGVVGALLGYNYEKSEAPESESPQSSPKEGSRWQYPGVPRQRFGNPHTAELWQKAIFPEYSLRMAKSVPRMGVPKQGVLGTRISPKPGFGNPKTEVSAYRYDGMGVPKK